MIQIQGGLTIEMFPKLDIKDKYPVTATQLFCPVWRLPTRSSLSISFEVRGQTLQAMPYKVYELRTRIPQGT